MWYHKQQKLSERNLCFKIVAFTEILKYELGHKRAHLLYTLIFFCGPIKVKGKLEIILVVNNPATITLGQISQAQSKFSAKRSAIYGCSKLKIALIKNFQ